MEEFLLPLLACALFLSIHGLDVMERKGELHFQVQVHLLDRSFRCLMSAHDEDIAFGAVPFCIIFMYLWAIAAI